MARRFMMTVAAVMVVAGLSWGVTMAITTKTTTVGVKVVRKAPR